MNFHHAWAAGIIDGEGCLRIKKQHSPTHRLNPWYGMALRVKMIHAPAIRRLHEIFGVGSVRPEPRTNKRTLWVWEVSTDQAAMVLRKIRPYLIVKAAEADLLLEFHRQPRHTRKGHRSPKVVRMCERMFLKSKELKQATNC